MGYRSDVAYVIRFHKFQDRDAFVSLMLAKNDEHITRALDECEYGYTTQALITFQIESVKWYEHYDDVRAHHLLMADAHELYEADYRFVGVGEDGAEDIQEQDDTGDLYDYISTQHILDIDFPLVHLPANVTKALTTTQE
jgi:hypothetical protein